MTTPPLKRRLLAEFLGTSALLTAVVGVSAMAATLSPHDAGLRLLENSSTVALALAAVIVALGPVSGAHFNPVVSAADWFLGRRTGTGLTTAELAGYIAAQLAGAAAGTVLGNLMTGRPAVTIAGTARTGGHLLLSEVVATAGLLVLIAALVRTGRGAAGPAAVGAYIGAACWFTSSSCFANPAVTLGRMLTGTESGIAPASVPAFLLAQVAGLAVACLLIPALYPQPGAVATTASADAVVSAPAPARSAPAADRPGPGRACAPGQPIRGRVMRYATSRNDASARVTR
ncbi:aquaporin [Actinoplanes sp. NPDC020271]|uniref:aquaporin n=1 Tax=Actinoplanes sp. NPDC020271 TaxID=3363896 RepID=UPI003794FBF4